MISSVLILHRKQMYVHVLSNTYFYLFYFDIQLTRQLISAIAKN